MNIDGCITGREVAKQCNVSIRTIREDIKEINELLAEYGIKIESILKKGYCLTEENKRILKENNLIKKVLDSEYITATPASPKDRQMYILSKLTSREYLVVDELAEALWVSQSTINNDVILVKKWLKTKLELEIHWSLNEGVHLKADERDKRNIISRILAARLNASNNSKYWHYVFGEGEAGIAESSAALYHIVRAATNENGYYLSGHSSQLFCLELLVATNRHQAGFTIKAADKNEASVSPVMTGIRSEAESYLSIRLPDEEWLYLQRCFESKQFLYGTKLENLITEETIRIVDEFLRVMDDQFHIKLDSDQDAREKLLLYVDPANRLFNKELGGGALLDVGVYNLSYTTFILGNAPDFISGSLYIGETGVDENVSINLAYPGGKQAQLYGAINLNTIRDANIIGTKGRICVPRFSNAETATLFKDGKEETFQMPHEITGFEYEISEVTNCINSGKLQSEIMSWEDSIKTMELLDSVKNDGTKSYYR